MLLNNLKKIESPQKYSNLTYEDTVTLLSEAVNKELTPFADVK